MIFIATFIHLETFYIGVNAILCYWSQRQGLLSLFEWVLLVWLENELVMFFFLPWNDSINEIFMIL